jgi:TolB-like protein
MLGRASAPSVEAVPPAAPATTASAIPKVAVLPFTHRGGDGELEFLAEDLGEDITRELARSSYFKVIAAGTMAAWRGKPVDHQALGRQLEARYLVEGKLQRSGDNTRLTVQLIDTGTASTVWSSRFVCDAAGIAPSPEEFAVSVAHQLHAQIAQSDVNRAMAKPGPWSGWEHFLRARRFWNRGGADNLRSAMEEGRNAKQSRPIPVSVWRTPCWPGCSVRP